MYKQGFSCFHSEKHSCISMRGLFYLSFLGGWAGFPKLNRSGVDSNQLSQMFSDFATADARKLVYLCEAFIKKVPALIQLPITWTETDH